MMKQEFERLTGTEVSDLTYEVIETVYMNYPGITDKAQIIEMYKRHGIVIFQDMYGRALKISEKESTISTLKREIEALTKGM